MPHEASRTGPFVADLVGRLPAMLAEDGGVRHLEPDAPLVKAALESYRAGLAGAADPAADAYCRGRVASVSPRPDGGELARVETALRRIEYHG